MVPGLVRRQPIPAQARHTTCKSKGCYPNPAEIDGLTVDRSREFRGVWVVSVGNMDWPSRPGLPVAEQKSELITILDRAAALNLNAVVLQVRPSADALYASKKEPWSAFLTGQMGRAPVPFYDPLEFAVEEAHARGLELHAWVNPYRAHYPDDTSRIAPSHIARRRPDLVVRYGPYLWLDPGSSEVRAYTVGVVRDIVRRYDIDGLHIDDYFYPYRERKRRRDIPFPDNRTWRAYRARGGTLSRDDWRRSRAPLRQDCGSVRVLSLRPGTAAVRTMWGRRRRCGRPSPWARRSP